MEHLRRGLRVSAVSLLFLLVGGCSLLGSGDRDTLVWYATEGPSPLVPILKMNEPAKQLCELIFDGLVNKTEVRDGKEEYEWALVAQNGYREEDPYNRMQITIQLRVGVLWHDGEEVTSDDVMYTWDAIQASESPLKGWLNRFVESISAAPEDKYKLVLRLRVERSPEAFKELFSPIKILPHTYVYEGTRRNMPANLSASDEVGRAFSFRPVGTGLYRIAGRATADRVELEYRGDSRDARFAGQEKPPSGCILRIRMEKETDRNKTLRELQRRTAMLLDVKEEDYQTLEQKGLQSQPYTPYAFFALVYNTRAGATADPEFRKGLSLAVNKQVLAETYIARGGPQGAVNTGIFPASSGYVRDSSEAFKERYLFDPEQARAVLLGRGGGQELRFLVCSQLDGERARILAEKCREMLGAVGVAIRVEDVNSALYTDRVRRRDFDLLFFQFAGFDHFYDIGDLFGAGGSNHWQVDDPAVLGLIGEFEVTLDWKTRVRIAGEIHARVGEICPGCFLFSAPRRAYFSSRLRNVTVHPEVAFATAGRWRIE